MVFGGGNNSDIKEKKQKIWYSGPRGAPKKGKFA